MNFADLALRNRTTTLALTAVMLLGGLASYQKLARLEDPEFTIKEALVSTPYPGASAAEVEEEVSDKIERAVQQLGQLKEVESRSTRDLSIVTVRIKDKYDKHALPQVWDELRRKVGDVQGQLPPGAGPSIVNDDFGDVWGVFIAIYGPEYTYAELKRVAKLLRRELLLVKDVAKVDFWGDRIEAVYVEPSRDRMAQLGVPPDVIADALRKKNIVADAGRVRVGTEFLAIDPTGTFTTVQDFESLLIEGGGADRQIHLRDVAGVRRGYVEPPDRLLRYDGHVAIGLGVSTVPGGNVVVMGEALERRVRELLPEIPLGIEFGVISLQSRAVTTAIDGFVVSLVEAVVIVVGVLLFFMGVRSGLLIGFILAVTIAGSFPLMGTWGVALERISLGALIIALGMLVDNAIVVVDGMLVRMQAGQPPEDAACDVVGQTAMPLLGATAVAIMAFGAIGLSNDSTGEFCRSLFQVVLISLGLSWVTAVTVTPVLGVMFLPSAAGSGAAADPYGGRFYAAYRRGLGFCLGHRGLTIGVVAGLFAASLWGFQFVDKSFFPNSTRPQFMVDFWLPEGTYITDTAREAEAAEEYLRGLDGVTHVSTLVGAGAMRFLLTYAAEKPNSAYAQFLVDVEDYTTIDDLVATAERGLGERHPDAVVYGRKFLLGPGDGGRIQARISGPGLDELRRLASETEAILRDDGGAKAVRTDWRQRVKVVRPLLAEEEANLAGITRPDVAAVLLQGFEGGRIGVFRERDELLPIVARAAEAERSDVRSINDLQVWSPAAGRMVPLRQVVSGFETVFEDDIIQRLNRRRTVTVHADPAHGPPSALLGRIQAQVEALDFPPGYELAWWGEYKDSAKGQAGIAASLPFFLLMMVLVVIALFNALRQPAVIWLCVPLALIGVTGGLLVTGQPFGFMALLGFLSLSGMLIKNAVVLIDEMEVQRRAGEEIYDAIVESGVSRLRPVAMAALTTALGLIPLLFDAFFVAMAVAIIAGLMVATVLTMVVVPVLYAAFFRVRVPGGAAVLLALAFLAGGCAMIGPDYVPPAAPVAEGWIDAEAPVLVRDPAEHRAWWKAFGDPVLESLVDVAYRQNRTLRIAGLRVLQAQARRGIAVGTIFPQKQQAEGGYASVQLSEERANQDSPVLNRRFDDFQVGFDAAWELDVWGRFRRAIEAADADLLASVAEYDDVLVSLVAEVAAVYVRIRTLEERLAVARANVAIQERSYRIADTKFRHGEVTELDAAQALSLLRDTQAFARRLETGRRLEEITLCVLLGIPPRDLADLLGGPGAIPGPPPAVAVGMPAELLRRRPDLRRAEREVAAQSARIGVALADLYPRFSLVGNIGVAAEDAARWFVADGIEGFGGPTFSWAILNYGRIRNNVRFQDARFQELVVRYEETVLRAQREVEDGIANFLGARDEVELLEESVAASLRAVEVSNIQYREGLADYIRVLEAQRFLVSAQERLAGTRGDVPLGLIAIYKALGGGWELREGHDFVPEETKEALRETTDWGGLLSEEARTEDLEAAASGTEGDRGWWRVRWWWPRW